MYTRWTHLTFLQTSLKEYVYIHKANEESSLEEAEEMCSSYEGYHLLSLSSHREQQLIEALFYDLAPVKDRSAYYIFISLKKQVHIRMFAHIHAFIWDSRDMNIYGPTALVTAQHFMKPRNY